MEAQTLSDQECTKRVGMCLLTTLLRNKPMGLKVFLQVPRPHQCRQQSEPQTQLTVELVLQSMVLQFLDPFMDTFILLLGKTLVSRKLKLRPG